MTFRPRPWISFYAASLPVLLGSILLVAAAPAAAPVPTDSDAESARAASASAADDLAADNRDPLDPTTPVGAVRAYIDACRRGDFAAAATRLDLSEIPAARRTDEGALLAERFKIVLDQKLWIDFATLSRQTTGNLDDGLPPELEKVGTIANGGEIGVYLERVEEDGEQVWKFAADTVSRIPTLWEQYGYGVLADVLPRLLFERTFLEVRLWQWTGLALLIVVAWLLGWLIVRIVIRALQPIVARTRSELDDKLLQLLGGPLRFLVALWVARTGIVPLRLAEPAARFVDSLVLGLSVVGVTWIAMRCVDVVAALINENLQKTDHRTAVAVIPLGRRTVKVLLLAVALVALLQNLGFNVTGLVAGLGVGGLAVALAAQKSIENLFGGISLIADQPVRVGDFCRFADGKVGSVEEIGLRSTLVRTLDRTVISVPNSQFSEFQLENFAKRDSIRLHTTLGLRYETSTDQLRWILSELRRLLIAHPKVLETPLRARMVGFGAHSLDVEVYALVDTQDFNEFCAIREDLFLRFMETIEASGSGFAFPSQTLYLGRDGGLDPAATERVEGLVRSWREKSELPFPDFRAEQVSEFDGTLDYPPEGSVARDKGR